jgi:hypothetical protein
MVDWGSVPAWLGELAGIAVVIAFLAGRLDARRELAAQVLATHVSTQLTTTAESSITVQVANYSPAPIFNVGVATYDWGRRRWDWRLRHRRKWWTGARFAGRVVVTIPPELHGPVCDLPAPRTPGKLGELPPVIVTFTDGNGHRWVRWPDGRLNGQPFRSSHHHARRGNEREDGTRSADVEEPG